MCYLHQMVDIWFNWHFQLKTKVSILNLIVGTIQKQYFHYVLINHKISADPYCDWIKFILIGLVPGILIDPSMPFLGATPDRLLITKDGEVFPLEIKCPFNWTKGLPVKYIDSNDQFVKKYDGNNHFFQMQLQMLLCKVGFPIYSICWIHPTYFQEFSILTYHFFFDLG